MSLPSPTQAPATPAWLGDVLGVRMPAEGGTVRVRGRRLVMARGILRDEAVLSARQAQTADVFGFKWRQHQSFDTPAMTAKAATWMVEKYGDVATAPWWDDYGPEPLVVDAGCGAALSALELFGERLASVRYLGVDVSDAVDTAAARFAARGLPAAFVQVDLNRVPLAPATVDVLFSEGVLHHTDSTEAAVKGLAALLKPGGRFLFYVYRTKAPVREFTDDYLRERLQGLTPDEAWDALMPLTRLGQALGELGVEVDVPEDVELLGIPAGRIDVQRLFYWYFCKAFHHPDFTLDEMNHLNYDWYAPRNAHRQTPEQVRAWCAEAGLDIEREHLQESGITVVARKE
ncbi:MAG: class I SAM-dependent methyltransferase [Actinomycetota bacterium]|nr:class I SAM-dependent methyltransferase [Actinomycetota bacterium]